MDSASRSETRGSVTSAAGAVLLLWGLVEGAIYLLRLGPEADTLVRLLFIAGTTWLILRQSRLRASLPQAPAPLRFGAVSLAPASLPRAIMALSAAASLVLALLILSANAVTADEYGYRYLAETLLRGRLWNPPSPHALHDVLLTFYIPDKLGKRLSQYPPAWPLVLAPFVAAHLSWVANPLVALLGGGLMLSAMREARVGLAGQVSALTLAVLSPFALFNDASLFNHTLTATEIMAVVWLDLRDARSSSAWNRVGIGFAFSMLLATRYEAFAIAFILFAADHLIRRRQRLLLWALPAAAGALPGVVLFGLYNWSITGSPIVTTLSWGFPRLGFGFYAHGMDGTHTPARAAAYTVRWALGWGDFASVAMLPLYAAAVWRRARGRALRWFDLVLPAVVVFFVFYPDYGGFQFGPRYWFIAYALVPLTIALEGGWRLGRARFDPRRLAALQALVFAGFTIGQGGFARIQAQARTLPLTVARSAPNNSMVLFPIKGQMRYVPWQLHPERMDGKDFTRNGPDGPGRVLLGLYLGPERTRRLCTQLPGRRIFLLKEPDDAKRPLLLPVCGVGG